MSGPAPIDLQSAVTYGVLAGSTVTNTGTTTINGDLGLHPGTSVTGAPVVTGETNIANAAAEQAQLDLTAAITDAASRTPTSTIPGAPAELGGLTLNEGVYNVSSSAQITGTLILNNTAPGQVWIFQIPSTLTTAANSIVQFADSALGGFIFWNVGSSATLGTNSIIIGAIMASESITATTGATTENLLAKQAVTLDTNIVNVQDDICYLKGTKIMVIRDNTPTMVKIEKLKKNDVIVSYGRIKKDINLSFKDSLNKIKWIGYYKVEKPVIKNYPVCLKKGSISKNVPDRDVWLSQKHRICINNTFTCVSNLINNDTIYVDKTVKSIEYYHLQTSKHRIINVSGIFSETMSVPEGKNYKAKFTEL